MKIKIAAVNKIKNSKSGMEPEKMEKELEAYFAALELEKHRAPVLSPKQQFQINPATADAWKDMFLNNKSLIHLDFSCNGFDAREVEIMGKVLLTLISLLYIAEGLKENHTILGIHMLGNEATTDAMGFIVPCRSPDKLEDGKCHVFTRI